MNEMIQNLEHSYKDILETFLNRKNELGLYEAEQFSKVLLECKFAPEELVSMHHRVLQELFPDIPEKVLDSYEFLIEMMIGYGLAYREHQSLRSRQSELEYELDVAATMQQALMSEEIPKVDVLDIGVVSVPAQKMSGDYFNFILDDQGCLGIAIADIIGKGVPAALCMSMIKYAIDSLPEKHVQPHALLESLNRVVERNVADNMFVTMMYGSYDPKSHQFSFSGAGHEAGFIYRANTSEMEDLYVKGLALGLTKMAKYKEKSIELEVGDFIVLLTDGVTECRMKEGFAERDEIVAIIKKYKQYPAQKIADAVYGELLKRQSFVLRDDFTLMIIRRQV